MPTSVIISYCSDWLISYCRIILNVSSIKMPGVGFAVYCIPIIAALYEYCIILFSCIWQGENSAQIYNLRQLDNYWAHAHLQRIISALRIISTIIGDILASTTIHIHPTTMSFWSSIPESPNLERSKAGVPSEKHSALLWTL